MIIKSNINIQDINLLVNNPKQNYIINLNTIQDIKTLNQFLKSNKTNTKSRILAINLNLETIETNETQEQYNTLLNQNIINYISININKPTNNSNTTKNTNLSSFKQLITNNNNITKKSNIFIQITINHDSIKNNEQILNQIKIANKIIINLKNNQNITKEEINNLFSQLILIKKYPLLKNYNLNQAIKNNILEHTTQIIDFTNQPKQIQQQTIQTITQSNHIHKQDILNYLTNKEENQL
jgi:hypothetical protein